MSKLEFVFIVLLGTATIGLLWVSAANKRPHHFHGQALEAVCHWEDKTLVCVEQ